jgi:hypothetical protein
MTSTARSGSPLAKLSTRCACPASIQGLLEASSRRGRAILRGGRVGQAGDDRQQPRRAGYGVQDEVKGAVEEYPADDILGASHFAG